MELQLEGTVKEIHPLQEGEGRNGRWKKQTFILETSTGQYPRHVCVMVWGDRIDQFNLKTDDRIVASIDIESREYNGRWYTDVKAWKVEKKTDDASAVTSVPDDSSVTVVDDQQGDENNGDPFAPGPEDDDLPF